MRRFGVPKVSGLGFVVLDGFEVREVDGGVVEGGAWFFC